MTQFVVFGEPSRPVEPGKGALDDPAPGQHLEFVRLIALDRLHVVSEHLFCPADELAGVPAIHEDLGYGVEGAEQAHQHGPCRDPVLNARRMHNHRQQVSLRVYRDVPLTALDFLARVVTAPPPFSAVLADCESIIATVGEGFRPCP